MFCKHKWEILTEVTLPSAYEQMQERPEIAPNLKSLLLCLFEKLHIIIMTCPKCGRWEKIVTRNP